jgi:hypothetical protein
VVNETGQGVTGVTIFVVDSHSGAIVARLPSGAQGRFAVTIPRRHRHQFEADGPGWSLLRREVAGADRIRLVMRRQPRIAPAGRTELVVARTTTRSAAHPGGDPLPEIVTGTVVDETRVGVRGVGLSLVDQDGRTVAAVDSDPGGAFAIRASPGPYVLLLFAPGLRLQKLEGIGPNRWQVTVAVAAQPETVRIQVEPTDPDNPDARERARLTFEGKAVSGQPRVSPTLADLQTSRTGMTVSRSHPVARQPLGAFCVTSSHCSQTTGPAVCCTVAGELADEYIWAGGIEGACRPARDCAGARRYRR